VSLVNLILGKPRSMRSRRIFNIRVKDIARTSEWHLSEAGYKQMPTSPCLLGIIKRGLSGQKMEKSILSTYINVDDTDKHIT
jgi:hypothetical protein